MFEYTLFRKMTWRLRLAFNEDGHPGIVSIAYLF